MQKKRKRDSGGRKQRKSEMERKMEEKGRWRDELTPKVIFFPPVFMHNLILCSTHQKKCCLINYRIIPALIYSHKDTRSQATFSQKYNKKDKVREVVWLELQCIVRSHPASVTLTNCSAIHSVMRETGRNIKHSVTSGSFLINYTWRCYDMLLREYKG